MSLRLLWGVLIISLGCLSQGTDSSNVEACPIGWVSYDGEIPNGCLYISDSATDTLMKAHDQCVEKDASLIIIQTEEKMTYFRDIIRRFLSSKTKIWIGQQTDDNGYRVTWLTKDGKIPAGHLPRGMFFSQWHRHRYGYSRQDNSKGLIYTNGDLERPGTHGESARFICEKHPDCLKGWFGLGCDKECHCYGQECSRTVAQMTCAYGCKIGWMGEDCSRPKEDAGVQYFCANSHDLGRYVHIRISTKGVRYENIHPVDESGRGVSLCNNTFVQTNTRLDVVTIKIFPDNDTDEAIRQGNCAGKIDEKGQYEWRIKIQEHSGVVSRNDREVLIECDFNGADRFQLSADTGIKRERWFQRLDIKKAVEHLEEKRERVELLVVDPSTGNQLSDTHLGSPVVLRINFGLDADSIATGVHPYNCYASSVDGEHKSFFLDDKSCPLEGFPISGFSRNGTEKSLVTKPFPLFGFDGTEKVDFHCSYIPCFGDDVCLANCDQDMEREQNSTTASPRARRSVDDKPRTIRGTVGVINRKHGH